VTRALACWTVTFELIVLEKEFQDDHASGGREIWAAGG